MKFTVEGREYEWDPTIMTAEESMLLEKHADIGLNQFNSALTLGRGGALTVLVFLAKKRAGEAIRWQDMMSINLASYTVLPVEVGDESSDSGTDQDPTGTGVNPPPDISATS